MNEDFLVATGGVIKSLGDKGRVGGYLVLFDLIDGDGEHFTAKTDYWLEGKTSLPLLYDHGRDKVLKRRRLTSVSFTTQPRGIWVEGQLPLGSSEEVDTIWEAVKADRLGLSSGAVAHLVERGASGRGVEIKSWPVSEASLTPEPAQRFSRAVALKSVAPIAFDELAAANSAQVEYERFLRLRQRRSAEAQSEYQRFLRLTRGAA
jgi:hypothetical protein